MKKMMILALMMVMTISANAVTNKEFRNDRCPFCHEHPKTLVCNKCEHHKCDYKCRHGHKPINHRSDPVAHLTKPVNHAGNKTWRTTKDSPVIHGTNGTNFGARR